METQQTTQWDIIKSLTYNVKNYTKFQGRASRSEFWWFTLAYVIIGAITCNLGSIALLVPMLACGFRRMQDVGKPGWFYIIPIYNLILALSPSAPANEHGEGPTAAPQA